MLNRASRAASLICVLSCVVAGQADTPEQRLIAMRKEAERIVVEQLRAADQVVVAWGAHTAAELRLTGCIPALRKALAKNAGTHAVAHALLDALIQAGAVVPGEELEPALSCGAPAIVLLSRSPDANRALLLRAFQGNAAGMGWIDGNRRACGNLLAELRDSEFLRELVRGPIELCTWVTDPGAEPDPTLEPLAGSCIGCSGFPVPKGYPPIARYQLFADPEAQATLVAPGPEPVFLHRSRYHDGRHCEVSELYPSYQKARAEWLERMLGADRRDLIRAIDRPVAIEWKDLAALDAHAHQARREAETRWRALVAACVAAKLLNVDPAIEPPPKVTVEYVDERTDKSVPLPMNPEWWR